MSFIFNPIKASVSKSYELEVWFIINSYGNFIL